MGFFGGKEKKSFLCLLLLAHASGGYPRAHIYAYACSCGLLLLLRARASYHLGIGRRGDDGSS